MRGDVRFYTMGDSEYFLGAVALVNSLRIVGHDEPITFLDLGLTPEQRATLATQCEIVDIDRDSDDHPFTFQAYPAVLNPSGICVIVDSDVIVTQRLDALFDSAATGKIAAFPDLIVDRCEPAWESIFHLRSPLRRGVPYVNSGLVAFDASRHREFLCRWWDLCRSLRVDTSVPECHPTRFADQDALNALLMSELADDRVAIRSLDMALGTPALVTTRVDDADQLRCSRNGERVAVLHSVLLPKPWTKEARFVLRRTAYVTCLRRCLAGSRLAITLQGPDVPSWLRRGVRGAIEIQALPYAFRVRQYAYHARVFLFPKTARVQAPGTTRSLEPESAPS